MLQPKNLCRAIRADGTPCPNTSKYGIFCGIHYPNKLKKGAKSQQIWKRFKQAGQVFGVASGAVKLVEEVVKLWHSLPFGPSSRMPNDYDYLNNRLGPSYPISLRVVIACNKGPDSVNWKLARAIYDEANQLIGQIEIDSIDEKAALERLTALDKQIQQLFDTMQTSVAQMFYYQIGANVDEYEEPDSNEE